MLDKGRKHFFVFFPRVNKLEEIVKLIDFLSSYSGVHFCLHDKTLLHKENEALLGRNLTFYYMLVKSGIKIENISFHIGSLFGFGTSSREHVYKNITDQKLNPEIENERFFLGFFSSREYNTYINSAMSYINNIKQIAEGKNIKILIKNLCLDYAFFNRNYFNYFTNRGYKLEKINKNLATIPMLVEMGDFPRHVKEMVKLKKQYGIGISLDMEFLRYLLLISRKYNIKNKKAMQQWNIKLNSRHKKMLAENGFLIEKGKPVFYEKELDIYEQIFYLQDIVEIAHLSGSIGPVFLDKKNLTKDKITTDLLLGLMNKKDLKNALKGKFQLASFDGYDDVAGKNNFENKAAYNLWHEIFQRQYLEDIYLLKEIGCHRIVQKMKAVSENAVKTFKMFNDITSIEV